VYIAQNVYMAGAGSSIWLTPSSGNANLGTTNAIDLALFTSNASRWRVTNAGQFRPEFDNTYDIGNPSQRVREVYSVSMPRPNLLVNGGFEVWQRGNGPFNVHGNYTTDRWQLNIFGTDMLSVSRDTANSDSAFGSSVCAACTFTLGTGGGSTIVVQTLKIADPNQLRGRVISASMRIRTSTASAVRFQLWSDGTGGPLQLSGFHTGDGTWQTLSASITVATDATQVLLAAKFAASCTAYLDNVMLVVGPVVADYVPLHPADDLARCMRYYELVTATGSSYICSAFCYGAGNAMGLLSGLPKAVTPTITLSAANTFAVTGAAFSVIAATSISASQQAGRLISLTIGVASGLAAGNAAIVLGNTSQTATISIEANP
jgi:hypothetical protein